MSLDSIKNLVTSNAARQLLVTQKHSPKILFVAGSVGVVAAAVLACRGTLKLHDVLDEHEKRMIGLDKIDTNARYGQEENDQKIVANAKHKVQIQTAVQITKLYAPAVLVGVASVAALTGSHVILSKRNGAVMAAYAGLDRAYKEYRQRVASEYGKDVDRKFATGAEPVTVEEKLSDGTTKTTAVDKVKKDGKFGGSPYAVVFDEQSKFFSPEPGRNAMTIQMKQNWANDKLRANGHLFLNEVHDMLGLTRTKAGACVGWVHRRDNEIKNGDNYVDFGVFNGEAEWVEAFIDGAEKYVTLDFNVDGVILDLI